MNSTYFANIHYDIHLDMKLDYTISRIFQEMSLSELETLHQLCELERTQILQSLALAVLRIPYAGYLLSGKRSNFLDYEGNILWFYTNTKKVSPLYVFEDKRCYKRILIFNKNKYILLIHFQDEHIFGIPQSHVDQKIATMSYNSTLMKINTTYLHRILHYCNHSKSFHPKASELSLVTQILIYNHLENILNLIYNITLEHNSFKNY